MATSHPLRLDPSLVAAAARAGEIFKRSIPRQIEYWAEIGRAVAEHINPIDLVKVSQGLANLTIESSVSAPVSSADVFAELETMRSTGELATRVSTAAVRYQASSKFPGYLEQVHADGSCIVGRFSAGTFTPKH